MAGNKTRGVYPLTLITEKFKGRKNLERNAVSRLNIKFDFVPDLCYVTLRHNNLVGMQYQVMRKKQLCCYRTKERVGEKKKAVYCYHHELLWIVQSKDPEYNGGCPTSVLQK